MTSPTDRLWLRRDTLYAATEVGVQITNATSGFELQGKDAYGMFHVVHPLLDGSHSEDELRNALGPARWEKIATFIHPLTKHGFLRWIPATDVEELSSDVRANFADQIAFLAQYTDQPHAAFRRFREARIHLLGTGPFAETIRENLLNNGLESLLTTDPAELRPTMGEHIIVTPTASAISWLATWRWAPAQGSVLPIFPDGNTLWALPHRWNSDPNGSVLPDWIDAVAALTEGGRLTQIEGLWQRAAAGHVSLSPFTGAEAIQRMVGVLLAYELFKGLSGALPAETASGAIAFDAETGQARVHPVHPHPWRHIAELRSIEASDPVVIENLPLSSSRAEDYPRWEKLVGSPTLPIASFIDEDLLQVPLKLGAVQRVDGTKVIAASLWTTADARISAIIHAYEDRVAAVEPTETSIELIGANDTRAVPTASVLPLSTQNIAGEFSRSTSSVGVDLSQASARARAQTRAALDYLVRRCAADGLASPYIWSASSAQATFLRSLVAPKTKLQMFELGRIENLCAVAVVEKGPDGTLRWQAACAPELDDAVAEALTELHGARQAAETESAITSAMLVWPQIDPAQFTRIGASGERPRVWIGVADLLLAEVESLKLFSAVALVLPNAEP